jgi:hypothetical protein
MFTSLQQLALLAQATDPWAETFFGLDADKRFVLMIIAIGCATGVICTVVGCVTSAATSIQRRRAETELKRELLDRGMSVDDITRIVESTQPTDFLERWAAACRKQKVG